MRGNVDVPIRAEMLMFQLRGNVVVPICAEMLMRVHVDVPICAEMLTRVYIDVPICADMLMVPNVAEVAIKWPVTHSPDNGLEKIGADSM